MAPTETRAGKILKTDREKKKKENQRLDGLRGTRKPRGRKVTSNENTRKSRVQDLLVLVNIFTFKFYFD